MIIGVRGRALTHALKETGAETERLADMFMATKPEQREDRIARNLVLSKIALIVAVALGAASAPAQAAPLDGGASAPPPVVQSSGAGANDAPSPGTTITMQNWQAVS